MPIVDYKTYIKMLDTANKNKYAYPAINVSSMETANAALAGPAPWHAGSCFRSRVVWPTASSSTATRSCGARAVTSNA